MLVECKVRAKAMSKELTGWRLWTPPASLRRHLTVNLRHLTRQRRHLTSPHRHLTRHLTACASGDGCGRSGRRRRLCHDRGPEFFSKRSGACAWRSFIVRRVAGYLPVPPVMMWVPHFISGFDLSRSRKGITGSEPFACNSLPALAGEGGYTSMDIPHNTTWEIKGQ
jgi:hypothetical protein